MTETHWIPFPQPPATEITQATASVPAVAMPM